MKRRASLAIGLATCFAVAACASQQSSQYKSAAASVSAAIAQPVSVAPEAPAANDPAADAMRAMATTCGANPQNAENEINFVCSLQSADLAHIEAGRGPVPSQGCPPLVACDIGNDSLVVRILFSPNTAMDGIPRATSVEITGFDHPRAHADVRSLIGLGRWQPMTDAPATPPPMRRGEQSREFDLSPEATKRILELASGLRKKPEPATWMLCVMDSKAGPDARPAVVFSSDPAGAFVELFFGRETHAYLRNGAYYGQAGQIAAVASGSNAPETRCRPPTGG